jgi:MFS family permease
VGALGSAGVVFAAVLDNIALLFLSLFIYGAGTATNLQARYAGADLARPERRGRALSTVLVATTVGAVVGPNLVIIMGDLAAAWGIPRLAGPFVLAGGAYVLAAAVLFALLRPDPLLLARTLPVEHVSVASTRGDRPGARRPGVGLGTTIMIVTQLVMVAIMTMTPIQMQHHGHGLGATGVVISIHIAGMYLPSPLSGALVDRRGSRVTATVGAGVLLAAGLIAAFAPTDSVAGVALALGLLGLGWNLGLVSGTAIVTDAVPIATRARTQGMVDLCIALAGAGGGLGSGLMMAAAGYPALAITGGVVSLAIIPAVVVSSRRGELSSVGGDAPLDTAATADQ